MSNGGQPDTLKRLIDKIGVQKLIAISALLILYTFFAVFSKSFRSVDTLVSIFDASYYIGFMAIGVTFVIITGGIDLSIGTVMMCTAIIGGTLYNKVGIPLPLALVIMILSGTFFGLINGLMVTRMKLPAFIATLGTMMISRGLSSIISNVQSTTFPLRSSPDGWYKNIFRVEIAGKVFPIGIFVLVLFSVLAAVILNKTKIGRYIFAIGSNKEATRLSGVNVNLWETLAYVISGTFAGIAGIAYAATYTTLLPGIGNGFELDAIAGVVVGGTSMSGGIGSILGTFIGVFLMSVLKVGLPYIDLQPHYQIFITGFVVIAAVYVDVRRTSNKK